MSRLPAIPCRSLHVSVRATFFAGGWVLPMVPTPVSVRSGVISWHVRFGLQHPNPCHSLLIVHHYQRLYRLWGSFKSEQNFGWQYIEIQVVSIQLSLRDQVPGRSLYPGRKLFSISHNIGSTTVVIRGCSSLNGLVYFQSSSSSPPHRQRESSSQWLNSTPGIWLGSCSVKSITYKSPSMIFRHIF